MQSLFYPEFDRLEIRQIEEPRLNDGEVLIAVAACGICGSELESFKTRSPRRAPPKVMGHEFCGTIVDSRSHDPTWQKGARVVSNSVVPCNACRRCKRGDTHLCAHRQVFGMHRQGAFADLVAVPDHCLIAWPEGLPAAAACLAEPLGNGVHVVNLTKHLPAETALVIGAGPIGLFCQQSLQVLRGSTVYSADLSQERRSVSKGLGAAETFDPTKTDVTAALHQITDGEGVDLVIDAVGSPVTKRLSLAALRPGGVAVWIGLHENALTFDSYDITLPEKQVLGTYAATLDDLKVALDLMRSGKVKVANWVDAYDLSAGVDIFLRMVKGQGRDIKAVLTPKSA